MQYYPKAASGFNNLKVRDMQDLPIEIISIRWHRDVSSLSGGPRRLLPVLVWAKKGFVYRETPHTRPTLLRAGRYRDTSKNPVTMLRYMRHWSRSIRAAAGEYAPLWRIYDK